MLIFLPQSLLGPRLFCPLIPLRPLRQLRPPRPLSLEEVTEHYLKTAPAKRKSNIQAKRKPRVVGGKKVKNVVRKSPVVSVRSDSSGNIGQGSSISWF